MGATALRRRNIRGVALEPATQVEAGGLPVMLGVEAELAAAEINLLEG